MINIQDIKTERQSKSFEEDHRTAEYPVFRQQEVGEQR